MWFCRNCYWRSFKFHGDARNAGNGNSKNILVEFQDVCPGWRTGKFPDSRHWYCGADTKSSSYWCLVSRSLDPIPRTSNGQQLSNHPKMAMVLSYIYLYRCLLSVNIYIYIYICICIFSIIQPSRLIRSTWPLPADPLFGAFCVTFLCKGYHLLPQQSWQNREKTNIWFCLVWKVIGKNTGKIGGHPVLNPIHFSR